MFPLPPSGPSPAAQITNRPVRECLGQVGGDIIALAAFPASLKPTARRECEGEEDQNLQAITGGPCVATPGRTESVGQSVTLWEVTYVRGE